MAGDLTCVKGAGSDRAGVLFHAVGEVAIEYRRHHPHQALPLGGNSYPFAVKNDNAIRPLKESPRTAST